MFKLTVSINDTARSVSESILDNVIESKIREYADHILEPFINELEQHAIVKLDYNTEDVRITIDNARPDVVERIMNAIYKS